MCVCVYTCVHDSDRTTYWWKKLPSLCHCKETGIPKNPGIMDTSRPSHVNVGETVMGTCDVLFYNFVHVNNYEKKHKSVITALLNI